MAARDGRGPEYPALAKAHAAAQVLRNVVHLATLVDADECAALVAELDRAGTLMPLIDPTRFLREAERIAADERVARAFLEFRREVAAAYDRLRRSKTARDSPRW